MRRLDPRSWPIRWRLTALSVGILAATLLALGGLFLFQLDEAMITITADHLREQARPAALQEPRVSGPPDRRGPGLPPFGPTLFSLPRMAEGMVRRLSGPDTGVVVFDVNGTPIASTDADEDGDLWPQAPPEQVRAALAGREARLVMEQPSGRVLVLLLPLRGPDGATVGVLELAGSLQLVEQLEARLRAALLIGTLLSVLAAGGLGLRATRAALRPLDRVIVAARRIEAGHFDERLRLHRRDEIGELGEAFDSMLDRLAQVLAAQRRFVADAAHELRTPLTALGGMVEMLQMGADRGDPSTVKRMLATMEREIGRLGRLVTDLLTLSRLDAERPPSLDRVALAPLVSEVAGQARLLAQGQQVELKIEATPTVVGDADRLKQVLLNLASNAIAYTPPDGRIEFRLDRVNGHARMVVADTGSGIPPEVLPRVMDRFVRGDPSRARATGGSGLGLSIARAIVEAHRGTIALGSEVGCGTTATVELPLADPSSENGQVREARPSASGARL